MPGNKKASSKPLTTEELEEEEMRNQLIDSQSGFYYDGMTVDEMKMLLNELNKSKENNSQNEKALSASSLLNESNSMQNTSQALESNQKRPTPTSSYREAAAGGNLAVASTSKENVFNNREKNSPDSVLNKSYGKNSNDEYNHDSETIFEKNSNINKDDYPLLGSISDSKNNECMSRLRPREPRKPNASILRKINLERWRLDPLQTKDDGAVPLKLPERKFIHQEEYLPYSNEKLDDKTFEALCQQMSEKLNNLHKQIVANERKTIWGSPIKISSKWKGPADKSLLEETTPASSNHTTDVSVRNTSERSSKRKALHIIATATENYSNDENSHYEYVNTKKRKCQQGKKGEEAPKKVQENHENKSNKNTIDMIEVNDIDDFSDSEFDNSNLRTLTKRSKVSTNSNSTEAEPTYPRRISPPIPGKKNFKGPRSKKKVSTQSQNTSTKNSEFLDENEISKRLHESNEMDDNDDIEITHETKPSPVTRGMQKKLNIAQSHLENKKNANEQKIKDKEEAKKQKEIKENLKKDELFSKQLQEEENEKSRKLDRERKSKEQELFYKNTLGSQKLVTKANFNVHAKRNYEEMSEDALLADDDDDVILTHNITHKSCPICQKSFPAEQIENHASECELFPLESNDVHSFQPSTSYSSSDTYDCVICNNYTSRDGKTLEEHVIKCRESAENQRMNGIYV